MRIHKKQDTFNTIESDQAVEIGPAIQKQDAFDKHDPMVESIETPQKQDAFNTI